MAKKNKKGIFKEFVEFINKGNALALAVGVIIGGAFSAIVTAINKSIISPIIAYFVGDADLSESLITPLKSHIATEAEVLAGTALSDEVVVDVAIYWGAFIQAVIDFLLIAIVLFAIVKIVTAVVNRAKVIKEKLEAEEQVEEAPAPAPAPVIVEDPADIKLLTEIRDLLKNKE